MVAARLPNGQRVVLLSHDIGNCNIIDFQAIQTRVRNNKIL